MWRGARFVPGWGSVPAWARAGLRAGLSTSVHVPVGIVTIKLVPTLWLAYPILVLPLLLAGPLAVGRFRLRQAVQAAALAGVVSGTLTAGSFAVAWNVLGDWFWMLTAAAGAAPMPPLPRIMLLPTAWFSWAQQDILFLQPPLAVALGLLTLALRPLGGRLGWLWARVLPRSIGGRLRLAFGALTVLALVLGMVGFGIIEEMHIRNHRVQLRADWQRQLGTVRATLDEELAARVAGSTASDLIRSAARGEQVERIYQGLASTAQRPGLSARPDDIGVALATYRPLYDQAVSAHQAFRAAARDAGIAPAVTMSLLSEAIGAHTALQNAVGADLVLTLASNDISHHERLIWVMALVALVAGLGLWTGERVRESIGAPLMMLGRHLRRVARGDFSRRVVVQGPQELCLLGESVNAMTTDLAWLYGAERERRAMAEAVATREQELSAAKEFWTNTLVHDLKTPLSMIVGWTDLLEHGANGPLPSAQLQAIQQIRLAAGMLEDLVADINDSFRLQAAALPIHRATVDPEGLLHGVAAEYAGLDRPVPDVEIRPGVGPILADARLVGRVLHNLIGNAYKHGGPGARVVLVAETVECAEGSTGAGMVRVAVDDDGPGIPEGQRLCVFERFMQGEGAARGSGLGLAFCKLVVEQLGGRIWADRSPSGGTRIAFELPCPQSRPLSQMVTGVPAASPDVSLPVGLGAPASLPASQTERAGPPAASPAVGRQGIRVA
jgi:signal transduction histidine kinase